MNTQRPNLLFILTDQQRFDALGAAGNRYISTPNLDKLARNGVMFSNCYVAQAVCSPSRASILTGLFPTSHGVVDNIYGIDDTISSDDYNMRITWPALLKESGYHTGYIGKWHLGEKAPACFNEWYGWNSLLSHWMGKPQESQYRVEYEADQAIDFLTRNRNQPFALYLCHYPPHTPYTSPDKFADLYEHSPLQPKHYYGAVSAIDWNIGRVLAKLHDLDLMDNTFIIFTSDHGDHFGKRPGGANKRAAYDECARVPLIMYAPLMIRSGQVRDELVSNVDLMPTILELMGIERPKVQHGLSLMPLLKGEKPGWRSAVCIQNKESRGSSEGGVMSRGIRTRDWKLILRDGLSDRAAKLRELYDHRTDAAEHTNVYGCDNSAAIVQILLELDYWARQIDDEKAINLSAQCARDLGLT